MLAALGAAVAAPPFPQQKPAPKKPLAVKAAVKPPVKKPPVKKPPVKKPAAKTVALLPIGAEKKAIQAKYDGMSLLVMRRDGNKLAQYFLNMTTPNFAYRDAKGRGLNRNKLVAQLKAQMKMVKAFKRSGNKVAAFGLQGRVAKVRVVSDFAMVFPNGKKTVSVVGQSTTTDTWVKGANGWKLKSIRTLKENVKYNGKPM